MSHKHYNAIAAALKSERSAPTSDVWSEDWTNNYTLDRVAERLAVIFADDNDNFDPDRFFCATGYRA